MKIKEIRKLKGLSGLELANKIGVSQSYLSDLENQKYKIKLSRLLEIGKALEVCPYKLVDICTKCRNNGALFFRHYACITVCSKSHKLYNDLWGGSMNEKTTVYIEPDLKEKVQIRLLRDREKKSLSALVNEVLEKWLKEQI
ncbi:helix-turn-helix domain-containing protein [Clostridium tagluense]|uniref:helix-turn-helix domain-containing protein n=1 Tax=Clostridium tagluense TaxID=360422 RepID=UPI001C6E05CD|nr:helix-turn-helix transcriptional regulator [Clostridium tagluense]MBW9157217.1 helix-turn-helix domain-containing protein [Clostridium tagluense]WLC67182.1 helix-turn-helix domain-containing protein [Clostridium tagluense]